MRRREFIAKSLVAGSGSILLSTQFLLFAAPPPIPQAVTVTGGEPEQLVEEALKAFGGMNTFISRGDVVVVKPNIGWDRAPQFAANTNPEVVSAVVKACFEAGAKKVKIFDRTCNNPLRCYRNSHIEQMAKKLGADVQQIRSNKFKTIALPDGEILKEWPVYQEYLEADKVINIPVAKHHSLARVTLGLKNLMGVMGANRGEIHNHFSQKLIDIDAHILPSLTIIDAYRILLRNGPSGGNLNDVKLTKTLIMSSCTPTADRLALDLFGLNIDDVPYIKEAFRRGLNKFDPAKLRLKSINLS
ncbi:hypothetical protein B1H10_05390 [candidate division KSB1 bacterium 4484_188]|nr:MAG: hypothetical protein B1H10_05390 [candidate division KSB1 bacterium 4484_188]